MVLTIKRRARTDSSRRLISRLERPYLRRKGTLIWPKYGPILKHKWGLDVTMFRGVHVHVGTAGCGRPCIPGHPTPAPPTQICLGKYSLGLRVMIPPCMSSGLLKALATSRTSCDPGVACIYNTSCWNHNKKLLWATYLLKMRQGLRLISHIFH